MKKKAIEAIYRQAITLKPAIRSQSLSLSANVGMNYALSSDFCVEDKGYRGQGITAKFRVKAIQNIMVPKFQSV